MGSSASKGARRLPTKTATSAHPLPTAPRPPPEAFRPPEAQREAPPAASNFQYGAAPTKRADENASFSGDKDDDLIKDSMDPQFMSNLSKLGQVAVPTAPLIGRPGSGPTSQRTLSARRPEYTNPTAMPPKGTLSAGTLTSLLDQLKMLPAGSDPTALYRKFGVTAEEMAPVRRWVNSPSVGDEQTIRIRDAANLRVVQDIEMTAVWVDGKDKDAPKR